MSSDQPFRSAPEIADRWLTVAAFLGAMLVLIPILDNPLTVGPDDPVVERLGATIEARLVHNISGLYYDDSFYYLQIARHVALGIGSTFDGIHSTNGYHPLWLSCLILLATWWPAPDHLLLGSFMFQTLVASTTAAIIYRLARFQLRPLAALIAVCMWLRFQCTYWMSWSGMEYGLQSLLIATLFLVYLVYLGHRDRPTGDRWLLALGVLASLAFLARVDNLLLAALLGLALALQRCDHTKSWRRVFIYSAPVVITVSLYACLNYWQFDSLWPISAELKRTWSDELLRRDPVYIRHGWVVAKLVYLTTPLFELTRSFALGLFAGVLGGMIVTVHAVSGAKRSWSSLSWPLAAFATVQFLIYAVTLHGGFSFQPWHFVAQPLIAALGTGFVVDFMARKSRHFSRVIAPVVLTSVLLVVVLSTAHVATRRSDRLPRFDQQPLYRAASWARAQLEPDALIGSWNAGIVSYFSDRTVINLDGLVNSKSFQFEGQHDLCRYFDEEGISIIIDIFDTERPWDQYRSQLGHCVQRFEKQWQTPPSEHPRHAVAFRWLPEALMQPVE